MTEPQNSPIRVTDETECNICYETGFEKVDIVVLDCCNKSKTMCVRCIHCLTTPMCPYCRKPLQENCIPYFNEANNISRSEPNTFSLYTWENFLEDENIINPYLYDDSRRLRRQIRRLRYEYNQRRSVYLQNERTRYQTRPSHHTRRTRLQDYSREMARLYNENRYNELFIMDD